MDESAQGARGDLGADRGTENRDQDLGDGKQGAQDLVGETEDQDRGIEDIILGGEVAPILEVDEDIHLPGDALVRLGQ